MDAVVDDALEEGLGLDALAHEPALHVGQGDDDGVDAPVADHLPQLLELLRDGVARAVGGVGGAVLVAHRILPVQRRRYLGRPALLWPVLWRLPGTAASFARRTPYSGRSPVSLAYPSAPKHPHPHTPRAALDRTVADFESPPRSTRGPRPARPTGPAGARSKNEIGPQVGIPR